MCRVPVPGPVSLRISIAQPKPPTGVADFFSTTLRAPAFQTCRITRRPPAHHQIGSENRPSRRSLLGKITRNGVHGALPACRDLHEPIWITSGLPTNRE